MSLDATKYVSIAFYTTLVRRQNVHAIFEFIGFHEICCPKLQISLKLAAMGDDGGHYFPWY